VIIQGTQDDKISLAQGLHMVEELQRQGCNVSYKEIVGGSHSLRNIPNRTSVILS